VCHRSAAFPLVSCSRFFWLLLSVVCCCGCLVLVKSAGVPPWSLTFFFFLGFMDVLCGEFLFVVVWCSFIFSRPPTVSCTLFPFGRVFFLVVRFCFYSFLVGCCWFIVFFFGFLVFCYLGSLVVGCGVGFLVLFFGGGFMFWSVVVYFGSWWMCGGCVLFWVGGFFFVMGVGLVCVGGVLWGFCGGGVWVVCVFGLLCGCGSGVVAVLVCWYLGGFVSVRVFALGFIFFCLCFVCGCPFVCYCSLGLWRGVLWGCVVLGCLVGLSC